MLNFFLCIPVFINRFLVLKVLVVLFSAYHSSFWKPSNQSPLLKRWISDSNQNIENQHIFQRNYLVVSFQNWGTSTTIQTHIKIFMACYKYENSLFYWKADVSDPNQNLENQYIFQRNYLVISFHNWCTHLLRHTSRCSWFATKMKIVWNLFRNCSLCVSLQLCK